MKISHVITDVKRFEEILSVFFEFGFEKFIKKIGFHKNVKLKHKIKSQIKNLKQENEAKRFKDALQKLGPTFIKFGQLLSVRPDLLPKPYIEELKTLQEHTKEVLFNDIKKILEKDLGKKTNELFLNFDKKPIATASLAQVHKGILKTKENVVIKIRKPNVKNLVKKDTEILIFVCKLLESINTKFAKYGIVNLAVEFSNTILREIDFNIEAENIKKIKNNLSENKIKIPEIFEKYTKERILIMSYEKGVRITDYEFKNTEMKKKFVTNFANIMCKTIYEDGFFHADIHPGNLFVTENEIPLLLDFGMVGHLNEELKRKMLFLFENLIMHKTDEVIKWALKLTKNKKNSNENEFREKVKEILENWYENQNIKENNFLRIFSRLVKAGTSSGFVFDPNIVLVGRVVLYLEGILFFIYPEINIEEVLKPYIKNMALEKYDPKEIIKEKIEDFKKNFDFYVNLPEHIINILKKIEENGLNNNNEKWEISENERRWEVKEIILVFIFVSFLVSFLYSISFEHKILGIKISNLFLFCSLTTLFFLFINLNKKENL
jgi:ubiquinone biosynthesis protein